MAFRMDLIYHSHIDIGYTERQERIASRQADFIRQGVDAVLADRGKEGERFRFTAEGFWAVEQYLKKYGERGEERLCDAIRTGRFELTAGYLHFTELLDECSLSRSLDYAAGFVARHGLPPIETAMSVDVNGLSAGYADALYDHGVRYLFTCVNPHQGGTVFRRPLVPFWWRTPSGGRILVWNGLTYHKANLLGLIPGRQCVGNPGIPGVAPEQHVFRNIQSAADHAGKRLCGLRDSLRKEGYAYDFLPLMGSGLFTDNSPVSAAHCDLLDEWNRSSGGEIELHTATLREFFSAFAAQADPLPEYSGDWTDWWTDGALASPQPLRLFRNAQRTQALLRKADPQGKLVPHEKREGLTRNLILYAEHTFGHSASVSRPGDLLVQQLDHRKNLLAVQADQKAGGLYDMLCTALGEGELRVNRPFDYTVVNVHDVPVSTVVGLPMDYWEDFLTAQGVHAVDAQGHPYFLQKEGDLRGVVLYTAVTLAPREKKRLSLRFSPCPAPAPAACLWEPQGRFENEFYRLRYNEEGIYSLIDRKSGRELLLQDGARLGQPVYQLFDNDARAAGAGLDYNPKVTPASECTNGKLRSMTVEQTGEIFTVLRADYEVPGTRGYTVRYRLSNALPVIGMAVEAVKNLEPRPEGLYTALPFGCEGGRWKLDMPGLWMSPNDRLPGTCADYFAVQKGLALTNGREGVSVNALDTPMVMIGGLHLWQYSTESPETGCVYSWLCNNKWDTNFKVECAGVLESRYIIEPMHLTADDGECRAALERNELPPLVLRD